jgi:hypothetical protein
VSGERGPALWRVVTAAAVTLLGFLAAPLMAAPAAAYSDTTQGSAGLVPVDVPAAPGLSVAVLGGGAPTDERAAVDYTIEVRNDGSLPYRHLAVSALFPAGFHLLHASPAPRAGTSVPTWTVDVAPGQRLDIQARVAAGTLQDLADGNPAPLADAPAQLVDVSAPGAQAWYSVSACVRRAPGEPPATCGLSSQLLVKTDDDTRSGVTAMVLLLGLPAVAALLGAYAWRARRDPRIP